MSCVIFPIIFMVNIIMNGSHLFDLMFEVNEILLSIISSLTF